MRLQSNRLGIGPGRRQFLRFAHNTSACLDQKLRVGSWHLRRDNHIASIFGARHHLAVLYNFDHKFIERTGRGTQDVVPIMAKHRAMAWTFKAETRWLPLVETAKMGANHVECFWTLGGIHQPKLTCSVAIRTSAGRRYFAQRYRESPPKFAGPEARVHERVGSHPDFQC